MFKKVLFCVLCLSFFSSQVFADEATEAAEPEEYMYYLLEPDIITNYITPGKKIGYVRLTVELMVKSKSRYAILENHEPLIRDRIITIFGEQKADKVKSLVERDRIRQRCLEELNELLFTETEKKPIEDVLFTKYLYQ